MNDLLSLLSINSSPNLKKRVFFKIIMGNMGTYFFFLAGVISFCYFLRVSLRSLSLSFSFFQVDGAQGYFLAIYFLLSFGFFLFYTHPRFTYLFSFCFPGKHFTLGL